MSKQTKKEKIKREQLQLVIFTLGDEEFGIEISQVREIVRLSNITFLPSVPDYIEGVMNLRGDVLAVMDLGKRYGLGGRERSEKARIMITEVGNSTIGLIVDSVLEVLMVDIENIEHPPESVKPELQANLIKGIAKFDERLIVLMNLSEIVTTDEAVTLDNLSISG